MSLAAGKRSSYLTLWRDVSTVPSATAASGQMVETPTRVCNVWGEVKAAVPGPNAAAVRGQTETWNSYHVNVDAKYIITIPYLQNIQATDYFTEESRSGDVRYNIAGQPLESGNDLVIAVAMVV